MSRVGSSLRRLLFVEVRADPPSANGIFARNVRQIDQEALLRISYFPPRPRTKKAESARQCPNPDKRVGKYVSVLSPRGPDIPKRKIRPRNSLPEYRIVESLFVPPRTFAGDASRSILLLPRSRLRLSPVTRRRKFPTISSSRAQSSLLELPRREMEEKFNHFVKPSATEFTRIAEARNGRTKFNRNGRSSDSFRLRRLPDPEVSGKRVSHTFAPPKREAGTYSSGNCSGFTPDSHLIPSVGALRRASENRCRAKITIFSKHAADSPIFLTEKGGRRQPAASFQPHGRRRFRRLAVR